MNFRARVRLRREPGVQPEQHVKPVERPAQETSLPENLESERTNGLGIHALRGPLQGPPPGAQIECAVHFQLVMQESIGHTKSSTRICMKKLETFSTAAAAALTASVLMAIELVHEGVVPWIKKLVGEQSSLAWVFAIGFAIFALLPTVLEFLVGKLVLNWRWLRRLVLGSAFIEGTWVNAVTSRSDGGEGVTYGVVEIFHQDGELQITGQTFDASAAKIGDFSSKFSSVEALEVTFAYTKDHFDPAHPALSETHGYSCYRFTRKNPQPEAFTGFFVTQEGRIVSRVQGWKESEKLNLSAAEKVWLVRNRLPTGRA